MPLISAALVLSISGPVFAQEWIEFANREDRFTCNFPSQPKVTETTYKSEHGADLPARVARPLLREGMLLGVSTHTVDQARAARDDGADYVAIGSMFATTTKPDFQLVGPALIRKLRAEIRVPLVGIGGITHENVRDVVRAGADGVAVISAVCAAPDPAAATRRFLDLIRSAQAA